MLKIKLTTGNASIEAEGSLEDVTTLLDAYWLPTIASPNDRGAALHSPAGEQAAQPPSGQRRKSSRKGGPNKKEKANVPSLDPEKIANLIKSDQRFESINKKILSVPGDWINKCKLVSIIADEPITSGDVSRVLEKLRIRNALSTLSRTLSQNSSEFLTNGENPVKYTMTQNAADSFGKWLSQIDE